MSTPQARELPTYDPAGSDEEFPAACTRCGADAKRTSEPTPSGYGFKVLCDNGHVTNGMPRRVK